MVRAFFQIRGIFHNFRAFKIEIPHIYSLIGQILKQFQQALASTVYMGLNLYLLNNHKINPVRTVI